MYFSLVNARVIGGPFEITTDAPQVNFIVLRVNSWSLCDEFVENN